MAIADQVTLFNLALDAAGTRSSVSSPNEASREAEVCNRWFGVVRDQVLQSAPWPCARSTVRLANLATRDTESDWATGDPRPGFLYAYAVPSDMIQPNWLASGYRFEMGLFNTVANPNDKLVINTDDPTPLFLYTKSQTVLPLWDPALSMAMVHALSANINLPLNGKAGRAKESIQYANQLILDARVNAANADFEVFESVPSWIAARGYAESAPPSRYIYPYPPFLMVSSAGNN